MQLTTAVLGQGLEEIRVGAFQECTSLREVLIRPAVKAIKDMAYSCSTQLTTAVLGEELEEIGGQAFLECTSLHEVLIPHAV
jgi:hypothetical protein